MSSWIEALRKKQKRRSIFAPVSNIGRLRPATATATARVIVRRGPPSLLKRRRPATTATTGSSSGSRYYHHNSPLMMRDSLDDDGGGIGGRDLMSERRYGRGDSSEKRGGGGIVKGGSKERYSNHSMSTDDRSISTGGQQSKAAAVNSGITLIDDTSTDGIVSSLGGQGEPKTSTKAAAAGWSQNRVAVDQYTLEAMKLETEFLLAPTANGVTVHSLALALAESDSVMFHHGNADLPNNANTSNGGLARVFRKISVTDGNKNERKAAYQMRQEELKDALNKLVSTVGSVTQKVKSWDDAIPVLSTVLDLPSERKTADEADNSSSSYEKQGAKSDVQYYLEKIRKATRFTGLSSSYKNWKQITSIHVPHRRSRQKLEQESDKVTEGDSALLQPPSLSKTPMLQKEEQQHAAVSIHDLMDYTLQEKLIQAEQLAHSKQIQSDSYVESTISIQEEKERLEAQREAEAKRRASSLLRPLTKEEQHIVHEAMYGSGPGDEVIAQCHDTGDSVQRDSMRKLQPGKWLNDEIIHYFLVMLSKRDEELCDNSDGDHHDNNNMTTTTKRRRKRSHFFKSFFMTKLFDEGNIVHSSEAHKYDYNNVKRWSKRVPGKDIFQLNKIFFPINVGTVHWTCAVIFMEEKRIQYYDSMGGDGMFFLRGLLRYLKDEHLAKKGCPLPDEHLWKLVPCTPDTPMQKNGYDCGVFTCMFADFLSRDCPLTFSQEHVDQCRQRIALSIMKGSAVI